MSLIAARHAAGVGGGLDDATNASMRRMDLDLGPLQLPSGEVSAAALAELERRKQVAVEDEDYERAGQLRDLLETLRPRKSPLTLSDCSPPTLEQQLEFFNTHGFVVLKGALSGEKLARTQACWVRAQEPLMEEFLAARAHGKGVSRHGFREMSNGAPSVPRKTLGIPWTAKGNLGDDFVDLIDLPAVVPLVERLVGDSETNIYGQRRNGAARCTECSARCLPPDADGAGYTYWHRDDPSTGHWGLLPRCRSLKMFINVFAVSPDGGPFAVCPRTHRLDHGPLETLGRSYQSSMTLDAELPQSAMPNHVRFASDAGDALIFDMATW